jgi:peptidoglycan hydrolase CwlO-like protein
MVLCCRVSTVEWWVVGSLELERKEVIAMSIEVPLLLSLVSVTVAILVAVKNNRRADTKEIEARIVRDTKTDMKLDEIANDVKEVKETVKSIQNDVKDHEGRIVKLEASYKAEHKRLDNMNEELFKLSKERDVDNEPKN